MDKVLLPEGWIWKKLGDVCLKVNKTASKSNQPESEFSYIDIDAVDNNVYSIVNPKTYFWKDAPSRAQQIVRAGDVLFSTVRTYLKNIALVPDNLDGQIASTGFCVLRSENADSKYLFYYVLTEGFLRALNEIQRGTSYPAVRNSDVLDQGIPLPPLPVQRHIVARIEELFSELDAGTQELQTALKRLKTYRQAVLHHYLSNEEWERVRIGNIISTINNGYTPKADRMTEGHGEIQFLKVYNLGFDGTLNYRKNPVFITLDTHQNDLKRSITYPNDVLINIVGPPLGKVSLVPNTADQFNINQAIVLFRPNKQVLPKFLSYYLQAPKTIQWLEATSKATAGQHNIKVSTCREIPFPVLELDEQNSIVNNIEAKLSEADEMEATIHRSLKQAEALRQSILKQAFEGKLIKQEENIIPEFTFSAKKQTSVINEQLSLF